MAELAARNMRKEAEHRLRLSMKTLATLLLGADERRPTEQKLSWQLAASKGDWESYDKAHFAHLAMLEADQEAIQQEEYDVQYETVHQLMEETEDLLEARRGALAAALQPPTPEVDVQYGIGKQKQESLSICKQEEEVELIDEKADEVRAAKEESLRVLLKNTALMVDDVLEDFTCLEDMEKTRLVFWAELSRLDKAEDEERGSGKRQKELGTLSIRRFKRDAMTRFAKCVELLNEAEMPELEEHLGELKTDPEVGILKQKHQSDVNTIAKELMLEERHFKAKLMERSSKSEEKQHNAIDFMIEKKAEVEDQTLSRLMKVEASTKLEVVMASSKALLNALKSEEEKRCLRSENFKIKEVDVMKPEKEEHEVSVLMIDKEHETNHPMIKEEPNRETEEVKLIHTTKAEAVENLRIMRLSGGVDGSKIELRKENAELLSEASSELDTEASKQVKFKYLLMRDPSVPTDNRGQVMSMPRGLERKLRRSGQLEVFKEYSEEEMGKCITNYRVHEPRSTTTKLRMDSEVCKSPELTEEPLAEVDELRCLTDVSAGWKEKLAEVSKVGRISDNQERVEENFRACSKYVHTLLGTWWSMWRVFASLLFYNKLKDEKSGSEQVCDVCNLHCDNKLKDAYRLCQVVEALPPDDCLVMEVKVSFRPRRHCGSGTYKPVELYVTQRLVLLVPAEQAPVEPAEVVGQDTEVEKLSVRNVPKTIFEKHSGAEI